MESPNSRIPASHMHAASHPGRRNTVPEVTALFWIIKMMSTTVGAAAADALNLGWQFGLGGTTVVTGALFAAALMGQLRSHRYLPWLYWITVLLASVFGTLVVDLLIARAGLPTGASTVVLSVALLATLVLWHRREGTLALDAVDTPVRERFYWLAVLLAFALGTAGGDWLIESLRLGYAQSALGFGVLVAVAAMARFGFGAGAAPMFWWAFVLTRPLGAACRDLLAQPEANGGLGLSTGAVNALFLAVVVGLVAYLSALEHTADTTHDSSVSQG
ncbi:MULTISPECIES: COG4705 family protein [Ralstonia]|uniref:COG4705 family protein n=1 Tax=Ralstonia TaxID=48736 RepID=UPI0030D2A7F8